MFGLRPLSLLVIALCVVSNPSNGVLADVPTSRNLRAQHDGPHAADGSPLPVSNTATATSNANVQMPMAAGSAPMAATNTAPTPASTKVKNPGGILGPLYAAFPNLLKPIALISDTIHNSNAALTGVQHTPDGIFQA